MSINTRRREIVLLWSFFSICTILVACYRVSSTYVDGHFLPADHDSFYHGRRILDAIAHPMAVAQFDSHMHAPEGSWITWPWAFDAAMAGIAALAQRCGVLDPMSALAWVAPLWALVNTALMLGLTRRLGLSVFFQSLVLACFAASPLTQLVHRIGMLDHHFIEYTFVLAVLYAGVGWVQRPTSSLRASILGALLGAAPAFHNGDFILQLPVLAMLLLVWWRVPNALEKHAIVAFSATLVLTTLLFLWPSIPFQRGDFDFTLHSWFHFYIAFCTASVALSLLKVRPTRRGVVALLGFGILAALPLIQQIRSGSAFVFGDIPGLAQMSEVTGPSHWLWIGEWSTISTYYSGLFFIAPFTIGALTWKAWRKQQAAEGFIAVFAIFGFALLLQQLRLHYFGSFALYLPLSILLNNWMPRPALRRRMTEFACAIIVAVMYIPSVRSLTSNLTVGNDNQYAVTRQIYPVFHDVCRTKPGIVLADQNDGHYIRFHTDCAVIANNFILTPQHVVKNQLAARLLASSLSAVRREAPYVKYLYVRRNDNILDDNNHCATKPCAENQGLRQELLFGPTPLGVTLRGELNFQRGSNIEPLARLFEINSD